MKPCVTIKQSAASKRKTQADPVTPSAAIKRQKQGDPASLVMRGDSCGGAVTRQILQGSQQRLSAHTPAGDCDHDDAIAEDGGEVEEPAAVLAPLLMIPATIAMDIDEAKKQDKLTAEPAAALAPPHRVVEEEIDLDKEDRASIVCRCTTQAAYTSEEKAKVLVLLGGFQAKHTASDVVTDYDRDTISCLRCELSGHGIRRNGKRFRGSPCPEKSSTTKRAMWITGVCNIRTREQAGKEHWRLQCLMKTELNNVDVKQQVTSVGAERSSSCKPPNEKGNDQDKHPAEPAAVLAPPRIAVGGIKRRHTPAHITTKSNQHRNQKRNQQTTGPLHPPPAPLPSDAMPTQLQTNEDLARFSRKKRMLSDKEKEKNDEPDTTWSLYRGISQFQSPPKVNDNLEQSTFADAGDLEPRVDLRS